MKATCKKHIGSLGVHPGCKDEELLARTKGVGMLLSLMLLPSSLLVRRAFLRLYYIPKVTVFILYLGWALN